MTTIRHDSQSAIALDRSKLEKLLQERPSWTPETRDKLRDAGVPFRVLKEARRFSPNHWEELQQWWVQTNELFEEPQRVIAERAKDASPDDHQVDALCSQFRMYFQKHGPPAMIDGLDPLGWYLHAMARVGQDFVARRLIDEGRVAFSRDVRITYCPVNATAPGNTAASMVQQVLSFEESLSEPLGRFSIRLHDARLMLRPLKWWRRYCGAFVRLLLRLFGKTPELPKYYEFPAVDVLIAAVPKTLETIVEHLPADSQIRFGDWRHPPRDPAEAEVWLVGLVHQWSRLPKEQDRQDSLNVALHWAARLRSGHDVTRTLLRLASACRLQFREKSDQLVGFAIQRFKKINSIGVAEAMTDTRHWVESADLPWLEWFTKQLLSPDRSTTACEIAEANLGRWQTGTRFLVWQGGPASELLWIGALGNGPEPQSYWYSADGIWQSQHLPQDYKQATVVELQCISNGGAKSLVLVCDSSRKQWCSIGNNWNSIAPSPPNGNVIVWTFDRFTGLWQLKDAQELLRKQVFERLRRTEHLLSPRECLRIVQLASAQKAKALAGIWERFSVCQQDIKLQQAIFARLCDDGSDPIAIDSDPIAKETIRLLTVQSSKGPTSGELIAIKAFLESF